MSILYYTPINFELSIKESTLLSFASKFQNMSLLRSIMMLFVPSEFKKITLAIIPSLIGSGF